MENAMPIRFDKLKFVKTLQSEGKQDQEVAEAFANALDNALSESQSQLLTKAEFDKGMQQVDLKLSQIESRLTANFNNAIYKMAGLIIAGIGLLMTLMKLF